MTSFTFTPEQLSAAPPEVRHWMVQQVMGALGAVRQPPHDPAQATRTTLSACSVGEALQILERLRGNFLLMQVFFEMARDAAPGRSAPSLHVLDAADILNHVRLRSSDALAESLEVINAAFREVHRDPDATLFGFDEHGHVYIRQETHLSIRQLWEQLMRSAAPAANAALAPAPDFVPPHLGPNEDVIAHALDGARAGR